MKYKIITLILILITQSVYSQNEFRIYVGSDREDHEDYLPLGQHPGIEGVHSGIKGYEVLTIDLIENQIQVIGILPGDNRPPFYTPNNPIINNDQILSFEYKVGSGENIDFKFDKSKNLITLTRQSFKWDGTKIDVKERNLFNGFTRQQLDNPTSELEIKYSEFFKPQFIFEKFHEKLEHPWGITPSVQLLDRPDKLTRQNRFILTRVDRRKLTTLNRVKLTRVNRSILTTLNASFMAVG